jgi:hypothetical protein
MLVSNTHYSSSKAAQYLAIPELLWALKLVGEVHQCYPDILSSLCENDLRVVPICYSTKGIVHFGSL